MAEAPLSVQDRRWRLWVSVGVVGFVVVAAVLGFFLVSSRGENGVRGALGIDHVHETVATPATPAAGPPPPSNVAWTKATLALIDAGNPAAGQTIALQTCAGCHGERGVAAVAAFPNLAGQHRTALYKQLRDYADGNRASPIMVGIATALDDRQMADLAAYFSAQPPTDHDRVGDAAIVDLARNGDPARGVPPCDSCHAQRGAPQGIPLLDGQPVAYLQQQLEGFAGGGRGNDVYGLMRTITAMLTPAEFEDLAAYYGN